MIPSKLNLQVSQSTKRPAKFLKLLGLSLSSNMKDEHADIHW